MPILSVLTLLFIFFLGITGCGYTCDFIEVDMFVVENETEEKIETFIKHCESCDEIAVSIAKQGVTRIIIREKEREATGGSPLNQDGKCADSRVNTADLVFFEQGLLEQYSVCEQERDFEYFYTILDSEESCPPESLKVVKGFTFDEPTNETPEE